MAALLDGHVVSGSPGGGLHVWDVRTGRTLSTVCADAPFSSVVCVVAGDAAGDVWFIDLPSNGLAALAAWLAERR